MERSTRDTFIAVLIGGGISTGLYWLEGHGALALVAGLCWGCGLAATFRIAHRYPAYTTGETWNDKRWTGLSAGLVTLATLLGVSPTLPISADLRLGLGFLVTGTGFVAYATGTLAVLERLEEHPDVSPSDSANPVSTSDD